MLHLDKSVKRFLVYCTVNFCVCLLIVCTEIPDNVTFIRSPVLGEERLEKHSGEKGPLSKCERLGGFSLCFLAVRGSFFISTYSLYQCVKG